MEIDIGFHAVVESIHIFKNEEFAEERTLRLKKIKVFKNINTKQLYFRFFKNITKGDADDSTKYAFFNYLEKSFSLLHPSLIKISGFSIDKSYLYYKYPIDQPLSIDNINLKDKNVQKILIGIASALSYLISKGYNFPNFSIDKIIFDKKVCPKLIDYINFGEQNKGTEKELLIKYIELLDIIIDKKNQMEESSIVLHKDLVALIERCKNDSNTPTFNDFIDFFKVTPFSESCNPDLVKMPSFQRYLDILDINDKIDFDDLKSIELKDDLEHFNSIEQICYHFFKNRNKKELSDDDLFY